MKYVTTATRISGEAGRSREGAWIEIVNGASALSANYVAPVRERGLKSLLWSVFGRMVIVAPVRERGLKCFYKIGYIANVESLP